MASEKAAAVSSVEMDPSDTLKESTERTESKWESMGVQLDGLDGIFYVTDPKPGQGLTYIRPPFFSFLFSVDLLALC